MFQGPYHDVGRDLYIGGELFLVPCRYISRGSVTASQRTIEQSMERIAGWHAVVRLLCLMISRVSNSKFLCFYLSMKH